MCRHEAHLKLQYEGSVKFQYNGDNDNIEPDIVVVPASLDVDSKSSSSCSSSSDSLVDACVAGLGSSMRPDSRALGGSEHVNIQKDDAIQRNAVDMQVGIKRSCSSSSGISDSEALESLIGTGGASTLQEGDQFHSAELSSNKLSGISKGSDSWAVDSSRHVDVRGEGAIKKNIGTARVGIESSSSSSISDSEALESFIGAGGGGASQEGDQLHGTAPSNCKLSGNMMVVGGMACVSSEAASSSETSSMSD